MRFTAFVGELARRPCSVRTGSKLLLHYGRAVPVASLGHLVSRSFKCQRSLSNHQAHDLEEDVCSGHSRELSIGIISWGDLDKVGSDEVDVLEATNDSTELSGSPASGLRCACSWGECWVEGIDIDAVLSLACP